MSRAHSTLPVHRRAAKLAVALVVGLSVSTTSSLVTAPPAAAHPSWITSMPVLKEGSRGAPVRWIQKRVGAFEDGVFGPATKAKVIRWQKAKGLPHANGIVSNRTWLAFGVRKNTPAPRASRSSSRALVPGTKAFGNAVLSTAASTARGARYVYGATGPNAFDCSGYVGYVMRKLGKDLPRTSGAMRNATKRISASQARPGDLFFVHTRGRVTHVGIVAGNGYWWEASNPRTGVGKHRAWSSSVSYGRVR